MSNKPRFRAWIPGVDTLHPRDEVEVLKRSWLGVPCYYRHQGYAGIICGWYTTSPHAGGQVVMYRIIRKAK